MDNILRQSTAATIVMGVMVDSTDGNTPETGLTIAQADIRLSKNGGAYAQSNNVAGATHMETGKYSVPLDTTDTATLGKLRIDIHKTGALAVWREFTVVTANAYDALVLGTDVLQADVTQLAGVAQSLTDLKDFADNCFNTVSKKVNTNVQTILGNGTTPVNLADLVDTGYNSTTHKIQGVVLADTVTTNSDMRGTDSAALATALSTHDGKLDTVDGKVDAILLDTGTDGVVVATASKTGYALTATGANLILKDSTFALAIADAMCDEILTGAEHNIPTSLGRRIREIGAYAIHSGTAQAGNSIHITLAAAASATDGIYNRNLLVLIGGTGAEQTRTIIDYDGTSKIATVDREWRITPDATTEYQIVADDTPLVVDQGVAQNGTSTTIKLREYASSIDDTYLCNIVIILAGTGRGQARLVGAYDGTTKIITICGDNWATTPDATSVYVLIPYGASCIGCITDAALTQINDQVVDVLKTDTIAEMAQGAPPVNPTIEEAINYLYRKFRNKQETTATEDSIYADDGTTKLIKSTISDDTVTFTKGEYESGV